MAHTLKIFKAGHHVDSDGLPRRFTRDDLRIIAAIYNPARHEAPLVIGHPAQNAPAYGWVKRLRDTNGVLEAEVDQVDPAFAETVRSGRYKKISASFYTPDSPGNPVPGTYYLRHAGFLGATPPAVKGLGSAMFSGTEDKVASFCSGPGCLGPDSFTPSSSGKALCGLSGNMDQHKIAALKVAYPERAACFCEPADDEYRMLGAAIAKAAIE